MLKDLLLPTKAFLIETDALNQSVLRTRTVIIAFDKVKQRTCADDSLKTVAANNWPSTPYNPGSSVTSCHPIQRKLALPGI